MKVLSKAERENQYRKQADSATRKAASPNTDKRQATENKGTAATAELRH